MIYNNTNKLKNVIIIIQNHIIMIKVKEKYEN